MIFQPLCEIEGNLFLFFTVLGVFFFLYAGLHDVAFDFFTWIRESVEDQITARVGGPAYFGWPVRDCSSHFYCDDLSFAHAQGDGLSVLQLLRGRCVRWLTNLIGLGSRSCQSLRMTGSESLKAGESAAEKGASELVDARMGAKKALVCSLTGKVMMDPVVAADGYSYERAEMESYLRHCSVSPVTGRPLAFTCLFPNNQLRNVLQAWHKEQANLPGRAERGAAEVVEPESAWARAALDELRCPITMSLMKDSVLTCDGHRCVGFVVTKAKHEAALHCG